MRTQRKARRGVIAVISLAIVVALLAPFAPLALAAGAPSVQYRGHVQRLGWQEWVRDGASAGTSGQALRVEALQLRLQNAPHAGSLECRAHVQRLGWQPWTSDGQVCGTSGQGLRVEAIELRLTGEMAAHFDVHYRTHVQTHGWLDWASNGARSGTQGGSRRMEAIQVRIVPRGAPAPGPTAHPFRQGISYAGHVQSIGWQPRVQDGATAGTSGRGLRVEALRVGVPGADGGVECRAHVQGLGWMPWVGADQTCGTSGRGLRVEAIQLRLTGAVATQFDIHYRTHAQTFGWLGWASNGSSSGTQGGSRRLEAVQVRLTPRGAPAPGPTGNAHLDLRQFHRATVTNVVDGDTIDVVVGGRSERVRVIGIDTPERGAPGFNEATAFSRNAIAAVGNSVYLQAQGSDRDRFGRIRRHVWLGLPSDPNAPAQRERLLLGTRLLRAGHGVSSGPNAL